MEAIYLACGAGGPQLKRNPLGGCQTRAMRPSQLPPHLLLAAVAVARSLPGQIHAPLEPPYRFAIYDARIYETIAPPQLTFALQSVRDYPTLQYRVQADLTISADTITVLLRGIINDSPIQQNAMGPADYSASLSIPSGTYQLVIASPSAQDRYQVRITDDAVEVIGSAGTLSVPPPRLYRIPRNSAYVHCTPAGFTARACEDFLNLASLRAHTRTLSGIPLHRPDPFFYPLPAGRVDDSMPQAILLDVDSVAWGILVAFAEDYTRIFQYAQYALAVGLYSWDGRTAQCWSGVCHGLVR